MRYLVGGDWNMAFMTFHILGMSSSQLTNSGIFQRGWLKPPTTNQVVVIVMGKQGYKHVFFWGFPLKRSNNGEQKLPSLSNDHGIWGSRKIPPTWLGADVSQRNLTITP